MEVSTHRGQGPLQQVIEIGRHRLLTDLAPQFGGEDSGPEPHDILAAALAACTTLTVNLYARRKGWPLDEVKVVIRHGQEGEAYALHRTLDYVGAGRVAKGAPDRRRQPLSGPQDPVRQDRHHHGDPLT